MEAQQAIAKVKRTRKPAPERRDANASQAPERRDANASQAPVDVDLEQIKQKLTIIAVEKQLKIAEPPAEERRDAEVEAPVEATERSHEMPSIPKTSKPRIYIPLRINCSNEEYDQLLRAEEEVQLSTDSKLEHVVFTSKANQTRFKKDSSRLKLSKAEAKFTLHSKTATPVSA
jgi:hypothetical protein